MGNGITKEIVMAWVRSDEWFARKYKNLRWAISATQEKINTLLTTPTTEDWPVEFKNREVEAQEQYLISLNKDYDKHDALYGAWRNKNQNIERGCKPYRGY